MENEDAKKNYETSAASMFGLASRFDDCHQNDDDALAEDVDNADYPEDVDADKADDDDDAGKKTKTDHRRRQLAWRQDVKTGDDDDDDDDDDSDAIQRLTRGWKQRDV